MSRKGFGSPRYLSPAPLSSRNLSGSSPGPSPALLTWLTGEEETHSQSHQVPEPRGPGVCRALPAHTLPAHLALLRTLNASLRLNPAQPSPSPWEGSEDRAARTRLAKLPERGRAAFSGAVVPLLLSKVSLNYSEPVEPNTLCKRATRRPPPPDKAWLPSLRPTREIPVGLPGIEEGQAPRHQPVSFFEPPGFHL